MPLTPNQIDTILSNIRAIVPDGARGAGERRQAYVVGAIIALNTVDPNLVPVNWTALALSHRTNELFKTAKPVDRAAGVAVAPKESPLFKCFGCGFEWESVTQPTECPICHSETQFHRLS